MHKDSLFNNFGFNIGFWLGMVIIIFANYLSYVEKQNSSFPDILHWGFPFRMFGSNDMFDVIYNGFIYIAICFGFGFLVRFI